MIIEGSEFLHERNPALHMSGPVMLAVQQARFRGEQVPNEPVEKISVYIGSIANHSLLKRQAPESSVSSAREVRHQIDTRIIKPENVPESYFKFQQRIAREQGLGDIEITPDVKEEHFRIIQEDQRHSLATWFDYLGSTDNRYKDWFKYYAIDGLMKLGKFNHEKGEFERRTKGTVAPYPELSRSALAKVYSWLKASKIEGEPVMSLYGEVNSDDYDADKEARFQQSLQSANFGRLYAHALEEVEEGRITPEQKKILEGSWKKYEQESDPGLLYSDLQGFGLDWCTAEGIETANEQLNEGDFYVFYTKDEEGKDRIPRVAIRTADETVVEVRGINPGQDIETELLDTTSKKLEGLHGGDTYLKRAADMKRVTWLEKIRQEQKEFALDDLRFLYEVDSSIVGFGYGRDPRIDQMLKGRDARSDLSKILECSPDQIATSMTEVSEDTVAFVSKSEEWSEKGLASDIKELPNLIYVKSGQPHPVNLEGKVNYSKKFGDFLLSHDRGTEVLIHALRLGYAREEVAEILFNTNHPGQIAYALQFLPDRALSSKFIDPVRKVYGGVENIAKHLNVFKDVNHLQVALDILDTPANTEFDEEEPTAVLIKNLGKFRNLNQEVFDRLTGSGTWYDTEDIVDNLSSFTDLTADAALSLMKKFGADKVYQAAGGNLDLFNDINRAGLKYLLYQVDWEELDMDELRHGFTSLSPQQADQVIEEARRHLGYPSQEEIEENEQYEGYKELFSMSEDDFEERLRRLAERKSQK